MTPDCRPLEEAPIDRSNFYPTTFEGWLFKLLEEMGEVAAAAGKNGRFGPWSVNPLLPPNQQEANIVWLRRELADLKVALVEVEKHLDLYDGGASERPILAALFGANLSIENAAEVESLRTENARLREALESLEDVQTYATGWDNGVTDATGTMNEGAYWHMRAMDDARAALKETTP